MLEVLESENVRNQVYSKTKVHVAYKYTVTLASIGFWAVERPGTSIGKKIITLIILITKTCAFQIFQRKHFMHKNILPCFASDASLFVRGKGMCFVKFN